MPVIHPSSFETPNARTPESRTRIPLAYADWLFRALHGSVIPLDLSTVPQQPIIEISDSLFARCVAAAYGDESLAEGPTVTVTLGDDPGGDPASDEPYVPAPATLKGPRFEAIGLAAKRSPVKDKSNGGTGIKPAEKPEGARPDAP